MGLSRYTVKHFSRLFIISFIFAVTLQFTGIPNLFAQGSAQPARTTITSLFDHNFTWISPDTINTALDGYPKFKVLVKNNGTGRSPDRLGVSFISNDYEGIIGGFANFPNGGYIKLEPGDSTIASIWSQGVRERAVFDKDANSAFSRDIGFKFRVDDFNNPQEQIIRRTITFIDWDRPVTLSKIVGSMRIQGTIPPDLNASSLPGNTPKETKVYIRTPHSQDLIEISRGPADLPLSFQAEILPREDWYLVVDQPTYLRNLTHITSENATNIQIERKEVGEVIPRYELKTVVNTPTGFWRGTVSESEETFVVFPGQENWKMENTEALKQGSALYKMTFDGTPIWTHEAGWEVWGGDMTTDGAWVAYVVNPSPGPKEHKMVILNGENGEVHWELKTTQEESFTPTGRILESLAIELSDDGAYAAIGTTASGLVTLLDVQNKAVLWSFPDESYPFTTGFGQIREMRFSEDAQYLYIGAGDSYLTKLRLSDRTIVWRTYIGAWPFVNGMNFSPDNRYIYTGTKAFELTKIDAETGELMWQIEPQTFDAEVSRDGNYVSAFGGSLYETSSGRFMGSGGDRTHILNGGKFTIGINREVTTYDFGGKVWNRSEPSGIGDCGGCQVQWSYLTLDEQYVIVTARDMTGEYPIPGPGVAIYERAEGSYLSVNEDEEFPRNVELRQNYPNPFNPTTRIEFTLPAATDVRLDVFSILGQSVAVLMDEAKTAGIHSVEFDASNLASGVYLVRLSTPEVTKVRMINLLK